MENLKKNLIKRGYDVSIFDTADEAKEYLLKVIDKKSTVGIGGSMTIKELAIDEELKNAGNAIKTLGGELKGIIEVSIEETDLKHNIVEVEKIKPCPKTYPRKAGTITKKPL